MLRRQWNRQQFIELGAAAMGVGRAYGLKKERLAANASRPISSGGGVQPRTHTQRRDQDVWLIAG